MRLLLVVLLAFALSACVSTTTDNPEMEAAAKVATGVQPDYSSYLDRPPLLPDYTRVELDNGIVLLLLEKPEVPLIGFEVVLRGGATADPAGKSGTASLLAELLRKGAGDRNATDFAATVEGLGGDLDTGAGLESLQVSGSFLSRDAQVGVGLLADLLMRPQLDEAEFKKIRDRTVQFIKAAKDSSPNRLIGTYAGAFVFDEHPYARPSFGDESSLVGINIGDVRKFYQEQVGADRMIVAVTGDFETNNIVTLLRSAFASWRGAARDLPQYGSASTIAGGRVLLIDKPDATQTYFWMGNIGVSKYFPQRAALALTNAKFGGSFTSMLNDALRVKSGLTYGANSRLLQPRKAGSVSITSFTRTETTVTAIDLALETLEQLHTSGFDAKALGSIKAYI
ncbi:MAG: insulinase family protein, partial [Gammaproteobacteria bacterium]|nr:insulinase family protein [Gammaproteobacteria bacterium]